MKNKNIIWIIGILLLVNLPIISAEDYSEVFNLWYLLVENVFGNFLIAVLGISLGFIVIGACCRMSQYSISAIVGLFLLVMLFGWYGSPISATALLISFAYFGYAVIRFFNSLY